MGFAFLGLLALGLFLLWLSRQARARSGLPQGRVIYTDTGGWGRPERPLFSQHLCLTGKPDYLVTHGEDTIPIEVKSSQAPAQPYRSHILQLAAYCLLVDEYYHRRPPYGIIKYADRAFEVDYTAQVEDELLATLSRMRTDLAEGGAPRSHGEPRRCQACGYRSRCEERLA